MFVVGSHISEGLAQQVPPQAAWPGGQQVLFAPQEPPAFAVPVPEPHNPELGLQTQAVRESPACIATLELGALNPLMVIKLSVQEVTVKPTISELSEFPACHVGEAF